MYKFLRSSDLLGRAKKYSCLVQAKGTAYSSINARWITPDATFTEAGSQFAWLSTRLIL